MLAVTDAARRGGRAPSTSSRRPGQLVSYGLAGAGLALRDHPLGRSKVLALPAYFLFVQVASLHAMWNLLRGNRYDRWHPTRADEEAPEPAAADVAASDGTGLPLTRSPAARRH